MASDLAQASGTTGRMFMTNLFLTPNHLIGLGAIAAGVLIFVAIVIYLVSKI